MSPSVFAERRGHALHQRRGRIVLHEVARQLGGDEPRRGRMPHQDVDDALAVALAAARRNRVAEHALAARIVGARPEEIRAALARLIDGPAGEAARHFGDVLLGVAAVHAERVQLHQLAGVVLVEAARPAGGPRRRRGW